MGPTSSAKLLLPIHLVFLIQYLLTYRNVKSWPLSNGFRKLSMSFRGKFPNISPFLISPIQLETTSF